MGALGEKLMILLTHTVFNSVKSWQDLVAFLNAIDKCSLVWLHNFKYGVSTQVLLSK